MSDIWVVQSRFQNKTGMKQNTPCMRTKKKKADLDFSIRSFDKARLKGKAFDALLPGSPKVISNKSGNVGPSWRELNNFVCTNGKCTLDGQAMAPEFMYDSNGKTVHVISRF